MSENDQYKGPKQDTGENVANSSASITKLKNKGTRRGSKNSESGSDVREACEDCEKIFKSEKDRMLECEYCRNRYCIKCLKFKPCEYEAMGKPGCMWFCLKCIPKIYKNILNEKVIEERCDMYFKTMNKRFEAIEKKVDAKCDSKEVKEIVMQEMDVIHTCRPNDDESRNLLTTQNSGIVVEETVREINERKNRETHFLIFNAPEPKTNQKEERVRIDMEIVGGLCNEVCNLNLDVKDEITKVIRLGKKQTDGNTGDTEQKPRPLKVVMKDTNKKMDLFKQLSNLRDAEDTYKCLSSQRTRLNTKMRGRKETPRGGHGERDK